MTVLFLFAKILFKNETNNITRMELAVDLLQYTMRHESRRYVARSIVVVPVHVHVFLLLIPLHRLAANQAPFVFYTNYRAVHASLACDAMRPWHLCLFLPCNASRGQTTLACPHIH